MAAKATVVVIGGGVAGLTAAHELKERGFQVIVYERGTVLGGKARSLVLADKDLVERDKALTGVPAEHGFRFFPGFYQHVIDTMSRIPIVGDPNRRVSQNLVAVNQAAYARPQKPFFPFPTRVPRLPNEWLEGLKALWGTHGMGLSPPEVAFAAYKLGNALSMCDARRMAELEGISWWDYMRADDMSPLYRAVVVNGLTQNFVAMKAKISSTKSVINILARLLNDFFEGGGIDRILNGPTSEVWIDHWVALLRSPADGQTPVTFHTGTKVQSLLFDETSSRITGLLLESGEKVEDPAAQYIMAAPVEAAVSIFQRGPGMILEHAPSLKLLNHIQVNWMSGVMFYTKTDVTMTPGHVVYLESPWALTSISQNQFWPRKVAQYGVGAVKGIVSSIISDWTAPGNGGVLSRPAKEAASAAEVAREALAQMRAHCDAIPEIDLSEENVIAHYLDADIIFNQQAREQMSGLMPAMEFYRRKEAVQHLLKPATNLEPLFINTINSWSYRPTEQTGIANLFLGSDYVRTNTDLATMEGANEAGRRAVNAVLDAVGSRKRRCKIFTFREPMLFAPLRKADEVLFGLGAPHPGFVDRIMAR